MWNLIRKAPSWVKQPIKYVYGLIPYEKILGKVFWDTYNFLQESQWWSKEKLEEYQMRELEKLLKHAYENVPYYRRVFNERGLKPKDIQSLNDLKKLPYVDKDTIKKHKSEFISKIHKKNYLEPARTGGTTGSPLHFWYQKAFTNPKEWAFIWRMWNWYDYHWGDKHVTIKRSDYVPERIRYNPLDRGLYLYNITISVEKIKDYQKIIERFKPKAIIGDPSILYSIAYLMLQNGMKVDWPFLKFIYCSSEKLYYFQKNEIQKAFKCKVYNNYGQSEKLVFMSKCEINDYYHILPEYGITEIVSENRLHVTKDGQMGEIVGTGFNNYAFPMIRYKTGDWAIISTRICKCGRIFPLVKDIIGRSGDFILTPSKNLISNATIEYVFDCINNFKDLQIVQKYIDMIEIQIVPDILYTKDEGEKIVQELKTRIGIDSKDMNMKIVLVDKINRPFNQKKRFVKSDISREFLGL
jgi:phenylacetate-CoA ligase